MEWDDYRIFLALIRAGSVRAASHQVGVSHSTVARRIEGFEKRMGVKLYNRVSKGYELTSAGLDLLGAAETVEAELHAVHRRLVGQDRRLAGNIRVTTVDVIATHLLMPDLVRFAKLYPETNVEVKITYEALDLTRREADIALRFVNHPPEHLIGNRLASVANAAYATPEYLEQHDLTDPNSASWIGFGKHDAFPDWVRHSDYPHLPSKNLSSNMSVQLEAARCGMGIANLPCFLGDLDQKLIRLPSGKSQPGHDLWLLRHRDTRSTARLQVFSEFIIDIITNKYRSLLEDTA